jgi:uncharacterized protein (UPF0276 family)
MLIGVNWTHPQTLSIIKELRSCRLLDFCEISLDNFVHLSPDIVLEALQGIPVGLHILSSRFLERSDDEIKKLAEQLRPWIDAIKPIYTSDHLAQFTSEGRRLSLFTELNYSLDYVKIKHRVEQWQDLLGHVILFENFPSHVDVGSEMAQPEFFERLCKETDAGLLFDFSNAYIAEVNQVCLFEKWLSLINKNVHYHVGGFRLIGSPALAMDTHDVAVSEDVLALMRSCFSSVRDNDEERAQTLVIEIDKNMTFDLWQAEIGRFKQG